ncbi:MAG: trypsin-like peptidase domain-containing protein [Chitinophagaceae bacterium]
MRKFTLLLLAQFLLCIIASSQVKTNFNNESIVSQKGQFEKEYKQQIDYQLSAKNIDDLLSTEKTEQLLSSEAKPFKLAVPVSVDLDIANLANWSSDNEFAYSKYTIKLNGALSASINFDKFYLPKGTEMYVYNENGRMITGPVTENENNDNHIWGSWVYQGSFLTVEIKTPAVTKDQLRLHANNIAYGYKEVYRSIKTGGFGFSGNCEINVICPLGNGWEAERNSVATILSATGSEFCTGSLVMNTCGYNRPFFLTANHCFDANSNSWRFNFQAWSTTCPNPGTNVAGVMYNGSTFRARNAASDFCLVELNTTPDANSGINYAGWSRSTTAATSATAIHHPRGDVMKISRANNPVVIGTFDSYTNTHWQATWSPQVNGSGVTVTPVTEPGSSGSPLFDQNHRVVGQLHGGPSACGNTQPWDFYGRFDLSWTGGGTNDTRLSNWLDQAASNAMTTNTTNVSSLAVPIGALSITGSSGFCTGSQQYTLNGAPNSTITWTVSSSIATITATGNPVTLTKVYDGYVTITATVAGCNGNATATKVVMLGAPVSIATSLNGCNGDYQYWNMNAGPVGNATNWSWTVDYLGTNSQITIFNPSSPSTMVSVKGGGTVRLTYTNICGIAKQDGITVYSTCHAFRLVVSPNPAKDKINVNLTGVKDFGTPEAEDQTTTRLQGIKSTGKTIMSLYDLYTKKLVKQWSYSESKNANYDLPVSGLLKGIYVLQVDRDNETRVTKVIIE